MNRSPFMRSGLWKRDRPQGVWLRGHMARDATAVPSDEEMRATLDVMPAYIDVVVSMNEIANSI